MKNEAEIKNLAPEEIYNIKVGVSKKLEEFTWSDEVWSESFRSATKLDLLWSFYMFQDIDRGVVENVNIFIKERNGTLDLLNKFGETALVKAVRLKRDNSVQLLIKGGVEVNHQIGSSLRSPLMVASYHGNLSAAQLLVSKGADLSLKDRNGLEALHYAVDNSQIEIVEYLLNCGVDINTKDIFGWTPLMRGIILGSKISVISLLIENGADVSAEDNGKRSCTQMVKLSPNNLELGKLFKIDVELPAVKEKGEEEDEISENKEDWWSDEERTKELEVNLFDKYADLLKSIIGENESEDEIIKGDNEIEENKEVQVDKNTQSDNQDINNKDESS